MSKAIGVEEVGLFGIIAVAGVLGFWVQSCNKAMVVDHDITERQHEFDVKNPLPCKDHSHHWDDNEQHCNPGEAPSIRNLALPGSPNSSLWLFCTCPVEQKQEKTTITLKPDNGGGFHSEWFGPVPVAIEKPLKEDHARHANDE